LVKRATSSSVSSRSKKSKDATRAPTTEPLSHNFLGETLVSIFTDEKERRALQTHTRPTDLPSSELEHSASRSGGFAEREHRPLICIGSRQTG
jgi:hypothetical protein